MKRYSTAKLNSKGIAHYIAPLIVVALVAIVGVGYMVASHADSVGLKTIHITGKKQSGNKVLTSHAQLYILSNAQGTCSGSTGTYNIPANKSILTKSTVAKGFQFKCTFKSNQTYSFQLTNHRGFEYIQGHVIKHAYGAYQIGLKGASNVTLGSAE